MTGIAKEGDMQTLRDLLKDKKLMKYSLFVVFTMVLVYLAYFIIKNLDTIFGACAGAIGSLADAFSPLLLGLVLAYVLNPAVEFFDDKLIKKIFRDIPDSDKSVKRKKKQRIISAAVTYITIVVGILAVVYIFASLLVGHIDTSSFSKTVGAVTDYISSLGETIKGMTNGGASNALTEKLSSIGDAAVKWLVSNLSVSRFVEHFTSLGSGIVNFVLALLVSFWLVLDKDFFVGGCKKVLAAVLSDGAYRSFKKNCLEIDQILSQFIRGICLDTVIIAVLSSIALSICGLKYAVLIGIFAGLCNVIPYFGPVMGMIPAFFVGLMNGGLVAGLIPVIALFIVQQVDSNFIYPKVVGSSTGLHPVIVLIAVVVGGAYGGIIGMLIAVPIASILKLYFFKGVDKIEQKKHSEKA